MRIQTKLFLTALLASLCIAGIGGLGFYFTDQGTRTVLQTSHRQHDVMQHINQLNGHIHHYWLNVLIHVGSNEPEIMNQLSRECAQYEEQISRELLNLEHWLINHQDSRYSQENVLQGNVLVHEIQQQWELFLPKARNIIALSEDYTKNAAMQEILNKSRVYFDDIVKAMNALIVYLRADSEQLYLQIEQNRRVNLWLLVIGTFLVSVVIFLWQRHISLELIDAMNFISEQVQHLSEGWIHNQASYHGPSEVMQIVNHLARLREGIAQTVTQAESIAKGDFSGKIRLLSERDELGKTLTLMTQALRHASERAKIEDWHKSGLAELGRIATGDHPLPDLCYRVLAYLARYLDASVGALYLPHQEQSNQPDSLRMFASYAYTVRKDLNERFELGQGIVGQAALERKPIWIRAVNPDYCAIQSGLLFQPPRIILAAPFSYSDEVKGVIELGLMQPFSEAQQTFLTEALTSLGIVLHSAQARARLRELLTRSRHQAAELQHQAEEMRAQQEELRQTNEELELRRQQAQHNNAQLEQSRRELSSKAEQLSRASEHKSAFLANISHELRTPLNSMLLLAEMLAKNSAGNLTTKQQESASTIHQAGTELLDLINDILDLSKVEAGRLEIHNEDIVLEDVVESLQRKFLPVAEHKQVSLQLYLDPKLPQVIHCDGQRLKQILINLLSNAFKFTRNGEVTLRVQPPSREAKLRAGLSPSQAITFSVTDTGIGISPEKQQDIFNAFHQADGEKTTREFGGTGLGLSISRQLASLMNGEIQLHSVPGQGSTFSLILPLLPAQSQSISRNSVPLFHEPSTPTTDTVSVFSSPMHKKTPVVVEPVPSTVADHEPAYDCPLHLSDWRILLVDDDMRNSFSMIKVLEPCGADISIATTGKEALQVLVESSEEETFNLVLMDLMMPEMDGLETIRAIRANPVWQKLPIIVLTAKAMPGGQKEALEAGANDYLTKPVDIDALLKSIQRFWPTADL